MTGIEEQARVSDRAHRDVYDIGYASRHATPVRCMGRTFVATAVGDEVAIMDVTDITRPAKLGVARTRDTDGAWQIACPRGRHLLTTSDLLDAIAGLRYARDRSRPVA